MSYLNRKGDFYHAAKNIQYCYFCAMFSKTFGYALRAVVYTALETQDGKKAGLQEIADKLEIPRHFLGKIMQDLVRHGIINSTKGPNGGFYANAKTADTPLLDILILTDGSLVFKHCALGTSVCSHDHPCPLHEDFSVCRAGLLRMMEGKTIRTLTQSVQDGLTFLT
jgi:Rrf2 family protein